MQVQAPEVLLQAQAQNTSPDIKDISPDLPHTLPDADAQVQTHNMPVQTSTLQFHILVVKMQIQTPRYKSRHPVGSPSIYIQARTEKHRTNCRILKVDLFESRSSQNG